MVVVNSRLFATIADMANTDDKKRQATDPPSRPWSDARKGALVLSMLSAWLIGGNLWLGGCSERMRNAPPAC